MQIAGLHYFEVYEHVARPETIKLIVEIDCGRKWPLYHLYVKSTSLNGTLDEVV
jgi:hypothetical protein